MKFTMSWLKDHLDTTASADEITTRLSAIGLEVEILDDPAAKLGVFTIVRVLEAKQHPNADRLRVAQVEIEKGKPPVEVVCGAPNCRTGMLSVFAPMGSYIPGKGITLEKKPVRGIVSNGMLCSESELGLGQDHSGIIDLDPSFADKVGARYIDVLGLADPVIEVKLTPNRPDCTGVRGIARDLSAAGLGRLKPEPKIAHKVEGDFVCPIDIGLEFAPDAADACPVFAGRYVKGVKNGPSPLWLQQRLKAIGQRPISALVDMTNYISIDRGRPLHVYDADKLKGAIRARLAEAGEKFVGLDGKAYATDPTMCVIADDSGPLGLGGIMGGESTGCSETTRNVLIECAYFDPLRTAATGRKAQLQTDARYRFERGVDPAFVEPGLDLATDMVIALTGGKPSKAKIAGKPPIKSMMLDFDMGRVERLGGIKLKEAEIRHILSALGFKCEGKGPRLKVAVPSWRPDIHGPTDLVEEIVRIAGMDNVPSAPMPRVHGVTRMVLTEKQRRARRARRVLAGRGMVEAITWSFITRDEAKRFGGGQATLELDNPISSEMSSMRPALLPGLLAAAQRNDNRGSSDLAVFEVGQAYRGDRPEDQMLLASGIRTGNARLAGQGRHWDGKAQPAAVHDAKADVFAALHALGFDPTKAQITRDAPEWYHPGRSGALRLGPKVVLAHFGELHPAVVKSYDIGSASGFEIFLDAIPTDKRKSRARVPLTAVDLLAVRRDFAFVLDKSIAASDVIKAAAGADKALIASVSVFDMFEGGSLAAEGKKSLGIEVTIQPTQKTLTDAEIEAIAARIVADVKKATGGDIRG